MKAAVLTKLNAPLELADVEPMPLEYGQVLVKVLASGICGAQLQEISGEKGNERFIPHLLGHEACGIVQEVGFGVRRVSIGDKVVMHWRKSEGIESDFPRYAYDGKIIRSGKVTTFSEYSIVSENRVTKVHPETSEPLCALLGCGLSTALGTVERDAGLRFGETVLIIGVGGLGSNLIRACRIAGASVVSCVDKCGDKLDCAVELGADSFFTSIPRETYDVVIDTTGNPDAISGSLSCLSPSGRFVMVGQPPPGTDVVLRNARHLFDGDGKSIKATQGGGFQPHLDIPRYVAMWKSGVLMTDGIISHEFSLDDINHAVTLVRDGKASRILIYP